MTSIYHPGGVREIQGFDPGWQTLRKMQPQIVEVEDRNDLTVHAGSTLKYYRLLDGREYGQGMGPEITECSDNIEEIEIPVASGETVYFCWKIYVSGSPSQNYGVCVHTPTNPTGGFQVRAKSVAGTYEGGAFGADDFNTSAGVFSGGVEGTLLSYQAVVVEGVFGNGPQPGMFRLQLAPAVEPVGGTWTAFVLSIATTPKAMQAYRRVLVFARTFASGTSATAPSIVVTGAGSSVSELLTLSTTTITTSTTTTTALGFWFVTYGAVNGTIAAGSVDQSTDIIWARWTGSDPDSVTAVTDSDSGIVLYGTTGSITFGPGGGGTDSEQVMALHAHTWLYAGDSVGDDVVANPGYHGSAGNPYTETSSEVVAAYTYGINVYGPDNPDQIGIGGVAVTLTHV